MLWKPIIGYEQSYKVSDTGLIKSIKRNVILKAGVASHGYLTVSLWRNGKGKTHNVHRLVAEAFIPNPFNFPETNHKDGNKLNNAVKNLEWCSYSHNLNHAYKNNLHQQGENHYIAKLTNENVRFIREMYTPRHKEFGARALSRKFNVSIAVISNILNRKTWKGI